MALPIWPSELPQRVLAANYNEGLEDGRLRTAMEAGLPKVRRRFSAAPRPVMASFRVSANGKARIDRFWREDTMGGTRPFLLPDPISHGAPLTADDGTPILTEAGTPILIPAWLVVMFGDNAPSFTTPNRGLSFVAAFPLTVMP